MMCRPNFLMYRLVPTAPKVPLQIEEELLTDSVSICALTFSLPFSLHLLLPFRIIYFGVQTLQVPFDRSSHRPGKQHGSSSGVREYAISPVLVSYFLLHCPVDVNIHTHHEWPVNFVGSVTDLVCCSEKLVDASVEKVLLNELRTVVDTSVFTPPMPLNETSAPTVIPTSSSLANVWASLLVLVFVVPTVQLSVCSAVMVYLRRQ